MTIFRYIKLLNIRYLSLNKSNLIESSQNIEILLKSIDENNLILKYFSNSLNEIHKEYSSIKIATSTKDIYQINSSKFNLKYLQLENDRKNEIEYFKELDLIILLRYIRYLQVASIYRFITFDIHLTIKDILYSIINLTKYKNNLNNNSLTLICELIFFVKYLSSNYCLSDVKLILSKTLIINYLLNNLLNNLNLNNSELLINELCSTLNCINEIPSLSSINNCPYLILKYLYNNKSNNLSIIKYLILIKNNCNNLCSSKFIFILNKYLIEIGINEDNINIICQLLKLISSCNYSHELFQKKIIQKIEKYIQQSELFDIKLSSRLIYYLCLNDPTNLFQSRSIILKLSKQINSNISKIVKYPQWIIQCQHGMMLLNIYNYQLLFSTIQQKYFPLLFRDLGIYSSTIYRQLFDIHNVLMIDRPSIERPLLNSQMVSFANKICDEYQSSIRPNQKFYNQFLNELKEFFNEIYGKDRCKIISTNKTYPYFSFDFLELNLPSTDELKSIGINTKQRIGILPILNSMLIKQQRSDGSLIRILSAHTTMRYRIIQKNNYQLITIFHHEYLRAIKDNTMKRTFQTNLSLKTIPHQSDNSDIII